MATKKKAPPKKKTPKPASKAQPAAGARLLPPKNGVVVRMYRIGHGDCFLLAFPGKSAGKPVYVLIDCGYKPGSNKADFMPAATSAKEIADNIRAATEGHIDVAVLTHEHQDHLNGITGKNFEKIEIGQTWLAWTEDPNDDLANRLRERFKDALLGLIGARQALADKGGETARVDRLLAFEIGGESETVDDAVLGAAANGGGGNKKSMKLFKDKAKSVKYLRPHAKIWKLPNNDNVRIFPLGPPRNEELIDSLDPEEGEGFHLAGFLAAAMASGPNSGGRQSPFGPEYGVPLNAISDTSAEAREFYQRHYKAETTVSPAADGAEIPDNPDWRRIEMDWLYSSEAFALAMNSKTNNSSLVLAFELGRGGKVLLFAADAQRGNWVSWAAKPFRDGNDAITVKELLGRTVLYKVGHHGSHNATLDGTKASAHPNLAWLATTSEASREFTAMITAVRKWAETQDGWDHPLPAIKKALLAKAGGRVFQTDTNLDKMKASEGREKEFQDFQKRTSGHRLYFDYIVEE